MIFVVHWLTFSSPTTRHVLVLVTVIPTVISIHNSAISIVVITVVVVIFFVIVVVVIVVHLYAGRFVRPARAR